MPFASNWNYVIAAYALTWVVLGSYWLYLHRTLRAARAEYAAAINEGGAK